MGRIIGIDLGTTNSCVAVLDSSSVQIIPNDIGRRTTPSVVAFSEKGDRLVGELAKRQSLLNPAHTIYAVKRLMGRSYDSPEVQSIKPFLPYTLSASENGDVRICSRLTEYSPAEISAMLLQYLKSSAEDFLGEEVTQAIITVPAYFDDSQRQATKDAGRIAGLEVRRIINEPTAAALAYGLGNTKKERVAIFDLGGGTFDVTLMEINDGVFEVLSTSGDSFLGGEDFDRHILEWLVSEFQAETGIDLSGDGLAMERLRKAAEKAKCELSIAEESNINLVYIAKDDNGPKHLTKTLTRAKFEELVQGLIERTTACCVQALSDAKLTSGDIDKVILVGGQTRTPAVQLHVEKIFGKKPAMEVNPDEVVAAGAALQGGVLQGGVKDVVLLDVLPLSLGMETRGGLFTRIIERNSKLPLKKSTVFTTVADNQSTVELHVLQGERELAQYNHSLAKFELVGIPPAPRGAPQIEVAFQIDVNGIVSVSATDKRSGKQQAVKIIPSTGLSVDEIDRMVLEAKQSSAEDRAARELASLRFRLKEMLPIVTRRYYGSRWLLERPEKEKIERILDQAKAIPAETDNLPLLKGAIKLLGVVSATLSKAIHAGEALTTSGAANGALDSDTGVRKLVKSALENIEPSKDS